jgi:hypothetical protein
VRNRSVKCSACKKRETFPKTDMYVRWTGRDKNVPKYWHHECWEKARPKIESREEFIEKELKTLDELIIVIEEMYNIKVPKYFYTILQDYRNGSIKEGNKKFVKYKDGVPFPVIKKAYELSRKKIQWSIHNIKFKNDIAKLNYGFKIMDSKINEAIKELKRLEDQQNFTIDLTNFNLKKFPKS